MDITVENDDRDTATTDTESVVLSIEGTEEHLQDPYADLDVDSGTINSGSVVWYHAGHWTWSDCIRTEESVVGAGGKKVVDLVELADLENYPSTEIQSIKVDVETHGYILNHRYPNEKPKNPMKRFGTSHMMEIRFF